MANFAKAQLLKYGWTEGKGLGKNENGITEALKPKLKFNTEGLGHKLEEAHWWESAFDNAAKNVSISSENNSVLISVVDKSASSVISKENVKANQSRQKQYNNFHKTCMLQDEKLVMFEGNNEREQRVEDDKPVNQISLLTDDELFKACGGRTAHKGARHGLSLNGKLERIAQQEKKLLDFRSNLSNKEITSKPMLRTEDDNVKSESRVDDNANAISTLIDFSSNNEDGFIKSKATLKKEKKRIQNLTHLLSVSCNINENNSNSTSAMNSRRSDLKRKRSKDRKKNVDKDVITNGNILETVTLETYDVPLSTNSVLEKKNKKLKKHNKHSIIKENNNIDVRSNKIVSHDSIHTDISRLKKKRSKHQENGEIPTEGIGPARKKLKSQKKEIVKLMERISFGNSDDEHIKNEKINSTPNVIQSNDTFSSKEALRLNRRISKKKKSRLRKKEKADLARRIATVSSQGKLDYIAENLMSVNITENVSEKLKESPKHAKKQLKSKGKIKSKDGKGNWTDI